MTDNRKYIITSIIAGIIVMSTMMYAPQQLRAEVSSQTSLTVEENTAIPKSIDSFEVNEINPFQTKQKITNDELVSITYKDKIYELELFEYDLRSPDAKAYLHKDGEIVEVPKENVKTYMGYVSGMPESSVSFVISDNEIAGFISTPDAEITVEPLSFYNDKFSGSKQIVYSLEDMSFEFPSDIKNGSTTPIGINWFTQSNLLPSVNADSGHNADTITDCDESYYDAGTGNWQTRQLTIVGGMNTAYGDTDVNINVVNQFCNNNQLSSSSQDGTWDQLNAYWDGLSNSRDLVMAFIGRDFDFEDIGTASPSGYIGGIDDTAEKAYVVFQTVDDEDTSDYGGTSFEQKVLASHEVGHLLDATHTSTTIGGKYTIMKQGINADDFVLEFAPGSISEINDAADDHL